MKKTNFVSISSISQIFLIGIFLCLIEEFFRIQNNEISLHIYWKKVFLKTGDWSLKRRVKKILLLLPKKIYFFRSQGILYFYWKLRALLPIQVYSNISLNTMIIIFYVLTEIKLLWFSLIHPLETLRPMKIYGNWGCIHITIDPHGPIISWYFPSSVHIHRWLIYR